MTESDSRQRHVRPHARGLVVYPRLREKLARDRVFLLASALSFNILITFIPVALLLVAALGVVIEASSEAEQAFRTMARQVWPGPATGVGQAVETLKDDRGWIGLLGAIGLLWASMRLAASVREVLQIVFDIPIEERLGYLPAKYHDAKMMILGGTLVSATLAVTIILHQAHDLGVRVFDRGTMDISWGLQVVSYAVALLLTVTMFYIAYRFVPWRRVSRFDAAVAAVFSGVFFELAKVPLIFYLTEARQLTVYGSFSNVVALALWVYYTSLLVILGAEIASSRRLVSADQITTRRQHGVG